MAEVVLCLSLRIKIHLLVNERINSDVTHRMNIKTGSAFNH